METVKKRGIDGFHTDRRIRRIGKSISITILGALFSLFGHGTVFAVSSFVLDEFPAPEAADAQSLAAAFEALMSRYHELGEFNGAVLVVREGRILVNKGYGWTDMKEKSLNGPETKFLIGSISKQFTAAMILKLIEMGRLSLDSTLAEALPYYRKDTGSKVKIRHLLEHTSGIVSFTDLVHSEIRVCPSIREFVLKYYSHVLNSEPGSRFRYNNGGYVILGAVIEQVTGLPYEEALRRHKFAPLGMKSSGLGRLGMVPPGAAKGYQRRGGQIVDAGAVDPFLAFSAGGLYSTTTDIALWERIFYSDTVLSSGSRALFSSAPSNSYFCGQRFDRRPIGPNREERAIVFHGGRIQGFNSLLLRIPQDRIFMVFFNNTDSTRLETMAAGLLDVLYGRVPRAPRWSLAEECRAAQSRKDVAAAIEDLRSIRRGDGVLIDPEPEEIQLNAFGYELLGRNRFDDALAVFAFAAEQFPNSWNAFDSLAEAQAALGRKEEAIKSYRKSLELNPENHNATEQIQRLEKRPPVKEPVHKEEQMKALIVYGSPHGKKSATYRLGSSFARGLQSQGWAIDEVILQDVDIKHCLGCYACWTKHPGICAQKDGMEEILGRQKNIDLLVLATPLYFYSAPGKVKDYWDRNMPLYFTEYLKFVGKSDKGWTDSFKFFLISTGGFPQKENFDGLVATARKIYGPAYSGEMLVPKGTAVSQDADGSKCGELYDIFFHAGKEFGASNKLSEETKRVFELVKAKHLAD